MNQNPAWLRWLEKHFGFIAIPNIAVIVVSMQVFGYILAITNPERIPQMFLIPDAVWAGEIWRVLTFMALPLSMSPLWMFFAAWFLYFIVSSLEAEWGEFKTTFYILMCISLTVVFSLVTGYPVTQVAHMESTLFLATAALYPEMVIQLFLFIPVKMKWLGWLTLLFLGVQIFDGSWMDRFYLLAIYTNYIVFFGPSLLWRAKDSYRKWKYKQKFK